jgi:hypothetical protein
MSRCCNPPYGGKGRFLNHAAPVPVPDLTGRPPFGFLLPACQALVRFLGYRRIEPHGPPLVRVPVYSFEF